MYKILEKQALTDNTDLMEIEAPLIAHKARAGQFIIVRKDEFSERIPLTIADYDAERGSITIIFQKVGMSTHQLAEMQAGDQLRNVVGPLGKFTPIDNFGKVVLVAGGVGIAPVFPIARSLHEAGNHVTLILGARSQNLLFWEDKMRTACDELIICTDDGSKGRKAVVTEPLHEILENNPGIARVWAIGPAIMMKFCCETTRPFNTPTVVSLDSVMVDGTGMCGACRVEVGGEIRFVCVDGPEFDGHQVNWDVVLARKKVFVSEEKRALNAWVENHEDRHICNLDKALLQQEISQKTPEKSGVAS
jgi:ferredoxin--NADP+ reductase